MSIIKLHKNLLHHFVLTNSKSIQISGVLEVHCDGLPLNIRDTRFHFDNFKVCTFEKRNVIEAELKLELTGACIVAKQHTVLSRIVAPSLIVRPLFFNQEIYYDLLKIDIFLIYSNIISSVLNRTCSYTMLFAVSLLYIPIFLQNMNLNLTFWYFKLWHPSKIGLGPWGHNLRQYGTYNDQADQPGTTQTHSNGNR